jgi:hypothetical protein
MTSLGPFPITSISPRLRLYLDNSLAIVATCVIIICFVPAIIGMYQAAEQTSASTTAQTNSNVAREIAAVTAPNQFILTDAQFLAAEADRNTPPQLVDTSSVRIQSGYLSNAQLIQIASQPRVHTVLFYTNRLRHEQAFHLWVSQHLHLVHNYGNGRELWIK